MVEKRWVVGMGMIVVAVWNVVGWIGVDIAAAVVGAECVGGE